MRPFGRNIEEMRAKALKSYQWFMPLRGVKDPGQGPEVNKAPFAPPKVGAVRQPAAYWGVTNSKLTPPQKRLARYLNWHVILSGTPFDLA